jgi:uncharacterized protein (DUF1501 family)
MLFQNLKSRRDFLRFGCRTLATFGAASAFGPASRLVAQTSGLGDYKALVCIFLFGGNDANNLLVPNESTGPKATDLRYGYANYKNIRQNLALNQGNLVSIQDSASGAAFGLHPGLAPLGPLYNTSGRLTLVANAGPLVQPVARDYVHMTPPDLSKYTLPVNLFSHSDQQTAWQNGAPLAGVNTGWAGRLVDRLYVPGCSSSSVPQTFGNELPTVGVAGNALMLQGQCTEQTGILTSSFGVNGLNAGRMADLTNMLSLQSGVTLVQAAANTFKAALATAKIVDQASGNPPTGFPNTDVGNQLAQVATLIQLNQTAGLGANRQIFFVNQGGYDTHSDEINSQGQLLSNLAQAMVAFDNYVSQTLGMAGQVVTFTESDFNRTFQPNGNNGTDHAWGEHTLVMGPVKGGQIYGQFPYLVLSGPDDSGNRGNWVPTTPLDQYGVTLAQWFGLTSPSDLAYVFPNWPTWTAAGYKPLGFLG